MSITVLIVDDDRWVTRALSAAIESADDIDIVGVAHNGEDAVTAFTEFRPRVVLMDVNMPPGMTGVDATAAIRQIDPDATVVILTTVAPGPGLARGIDAGASAAVNKNAPDEILLRTIRAFAHGEDPRLLSHLTSDLMINGTDDLEAFGERPSLTTAEKETLLLICEGLSYEDIAARRGVTPSTVITHARDLRQKLKARNAAQLIVRAMQLKYIS